MSSELCKMKSSLWIEQKSHSEKFKWDKMKIIQKTTIPLQPFNSLDNIHFQTFTIKFKRM